tara:strand:+ start:820 stop:1398 length:579 start_codon:yes stop_codon:yes gene_type:complete
MLFLYSNYSYSSGCRSYYTSKVTYTSKDSSKSKSLRLAIGGVGLVSSITAFALTAGLGSPVALPIGISSIVLMAGETSYTFYSSWKPFSQYFNDNLIYKVIDEADQFLKKENVKKQKSFLNFYSQDIFFPFTQEEVANSLVELDQRIEGICKISDNLLFEKKKQQFFFESKENITVKVHNYLLDKKLNNFNA